MVVLAQTNSLPGNLCIARFVALAMTPSCPPRCYTDITRGE